MHDHEVAIPNTDKDDHPKSVKPISLEEMLDAQREDFKCQQYVATIGLPTFHFDFNKDGLLIRQSPLEGAIQVVVLDKRRERFIS